MKRVAPGALVLLGAASTPFSGWSKAKAAVDRAVADARGVSLAPWSVRDLRRTVATGLQRLSVRLEVTEAVLNNVSGSRAGIARVYQRHDWAGREARHPRRLVRPHVLAVAERLGAAGNVKTRDILFISMEVRLRIVSSSPHDWS